MFETLSMHKIVYSCGMPDQSTHIAKLGPFMAKSVTSIWLSVNML